MDKKYYYNQDIWQLFHKKRNKVDILFEAMDFMQQYNGRSTTDCLALAMGFEQSTDNKNQECYERRII